MSRTGVQHPEVDETLYVDECVIRVACPKCKVRAGVPCKGARFDWLAKGERRGFRYVQYIHPARSNLFCEWKQAGRPRTIPASVFETYVTQYGKFPKRIDTKTRCDPESPVLRTPKRKSQASKKAKRGAPLERQTIKHGLVTWEGYAGNKLWSWSPYVELGNYDYTSINVFTDLPPFGQTSLSFMGHDHKCESREAAFDLAVQLVVERSFLDVLGERARWRIRELERRFGQELIG